MERKDTLAQNNVTKEELEKELEYSTSLINKLIETWLSNNRLLEALKQRNSIIKRQRKELKNLNEEYKHIYRLFSKYSSERYRLQEELYSVKKFAYVNLFLLIICVVYILITLFIK